MITMQLFRLSMLEVAVHLGILFRVKYSWQEYRNRGGVTSLYWVGNGDGGGCPGLWHYLASLSLLVVIDYTRYTFPFQLLYKIEYYTGFRTRFSLVLMWRCSLLTVNFEVNTLVHHALIQQNKNFSLKLSRICMFYIISIA